VQHTANGGARYDFIAKYNKQNMYLSAKTNKIGHKIAPQVIGQSMPKRFCEIMKISYSNNRNLKKYIQENIADVLYQIERYTFDCPIVYYNEKNKTIEFIELITPINWKEIDDYTWTKKYDVWECSSTLKLTKALVEFQFHTSKRSNIAIRWVLNNLLERFNDHFRITTLWKG
jgi:hypothetical protein